MIYHFQSLGQYSFLVNHWSLCRDHNLTEQQHAETVWLGVTVLHLRRLHMRSAGIESKMSCEDVSGYRLRKQRGILSLYNPGVFPWRLQQSCRAGHTALCKVTCSLAKETSHFLFIIPTRREEARSSGVHKHTHVRTLPVTSMWYSNIFYWHGTTVDYFKCNELVLLAAKIKFCPLLPLFACLAGLRGYFQDSGSKLCLCKSQTKPHYYEVAVIPYSLSLLSDVVTAAFHSKNPPNVLPLELRSVLWKHAVIISGLNSQFVQSTW